MKLRLAALVVVSAGICYGVAANSVNWEVFTWLIVGGTLLTGASNGFNEVIERELDALMERTRSRPLPTGRMSVYEGVILASLSGLTGIGMLWLFINPMSGILGLVAMSSYVLVYTPLKRVHPFAVFVGAIPGAIPPMLGCVAATDGFGSITQLALLMFSVQFIWQFPHFWAIAWRVHEDYLKAGFKMLPSVGGRDRASAFQILIYTLGLVPISLLPTFFGYVGNIAAVVCVIAGAVFAKQAMDLYRSLDSDDAKRLMFGSFVYLPVVQLAYLLDKVDVAVAELPFPFFNL
jgi:heme o synthase